MSLMVHKCVVRASLATFLVLIISGCTGGSSFPQFGGDNAFKFLEQQCDFGPRPLGTDAHEKTADYLKAALEPYADQVFEQQFTHTPRREKKVYTGRNIFAVFGKEKQRWILLLAHYDTRPFADQEIDRVKAAQPVLGANDGASGCAVLLELARMFHEKRPDVGVVMFFTDGEDFGPTPNEMLLGSKAFAEHWQDVMKPVSGFRKFEYGILLDMVGDKDLQIYKEGFSAQAAPAIVSKVWAAAGELGYEKFFKPERKHTIEDDHMPLLAVGIKCIDIIDFDYAHWHTVDDTVDKCSPESLKIVGDTVAKVLYSEPAEMPAK